MDAEILNEEYLQEVWIAAVELGLAARRQELLGGIAPAVVAGLTVSTSPMAQLLLDLRALSVTLVDESVPVVTWLRNAWLLVGDMESGEIFAESLTHLGHAIPRRPKGKGEESAARAAGVGAPGKVTKQRRAARSARNGGSVQAGNRSVVVMGDMVGSRVSTGDAGRRGRGKR